MKHEYINSHEPIYNYLLRYFLPDLSNPHFRQDAAQEIEQNERMTHCRYMAAWLPHESHYNEILNKLKQLCESNRKAVCVSLLIASIGNSMADMGAEFVVFLLVRCYTVDIRRNGWVKSNKSEARHMRYLLYNADRQVAAFDYEFGTISRFEEIEPKLLPKQLCGATAEGFTLWLRNRTMDLKPVQHRKLAKILISTQDKTAIAIRTHMYSVSDAFTCFANGEFEPRAHLCCTENQNAISGFIFSSYETPLKRVSIITPNASTDGSFPKTWKLENGEWWLYKIQSSDATRSEREISRVLMDCGWDAAEYQYVGSYRTRIRSRNFVEENEFFEPYDSLRFMFQGKSDDEQTIYENLASLGQDFEKAYRRILLSDALFTNTDRHMRNFGVIRSSKSGDILRMAPNFDNNQAYRANPGGRFTDGMLRAFKTSFGLTQNDVNDLNTLIEACKKNKYLAAAAEIGERFLNN